MGTAFDPACATTYGFFGQNSIAVNEAADPAGCNSQKTINLPVILPGNSTATVSVSGSATAGEDFTFPSTITNTNSVTDKIYLPVTIRNDAVIENNESLQLSLSINNTGNSAVRNVLQLVITDDDVVPVIGSGSRTLLSESFALPDGSTGPSGWITVAEIADDVSDPSAFKGFNYWQIAGGQLVITGKEPLTGVALPAGNYYNNSESRSYIQTPLIDATGLSLVNLSFDFRVQGEVDPQKINIGDPDIDKLPVFDYMSVMYSLDGINWTEMTSGDFKKFASALPATGSFTGRLPAAVANRKFYLAFKWYNDTNAGGPESVKIDNVLLTGSPRTPENDPGHNSRETLNAGNDIYFFSIQDGQVITKIQNNSATRSYGCTNTFIEKTGSGAFNLYQGRDGIHKVSEKIVRVEPSLSFKGSSVITLYFSEEQVSALEAATGYSRNDFQVYQVNAASHMLAASNNTKRFTPVQTSANGVVSYTFTTGNDYIHGSYAIGVPVTLFLTQKPVIQPENSVEGFRFSRVFPNPVKNRISIDVTAPQNARLLIEVVNSLGQVVERRQAGVFQGNQRIELNITGLSAGSYMIRTRAENGELLDSQSIVK